MAEGETRALLGEGAVVVDNGWHPRGVAHVIQPPRFGAHVPARKAGTRRDACTPVFIAATFTVAKSSSGAHRWMDG